MRFNKNIVRFNSLLREKIKIKYVFNSLNGHVLCKGQVELLLNGAHVRFNFKKYGNTSLPQGQL